MKKTVLLLLYISLANITLSQIYKESVEFTYTRLPKKPLSKDVKSYRTEINLEYLDKVKLERKEWENEVKRKQEEKAKEKEAYAKKSLASRLAENALVGSTKPDEIGDMFKYFPSVSDPTIYSNSVDIDGMERKDSEYDITVQVTVKGFKHQITNEFNEKSSKYRMKVVYSCPLLVNVVKDDNILYSTSIGQLSSVYTTKEDQYLAKLQANWKKSRLSGGNNSRSR